MFHEFQANLHSPSQFIHIYNRYFPAATHRAALTHALSSVLALDNVDEKVHLFILDSFIAHSDHLSDSQFKQGLLPFIKQTLGQTDGERTEMLLSTLRLFVVLVDYRSNILSSTVAEWLSALLTFLATHFSPSLSTTYGDLLIDLLAKIVKQFTPLSKEIVDVLSRSSAVISTDFLQQVKSCLKNTDDSRFASFALHLWQSLASLLSRLLIRGHGKGNEMLSVMEEGKFAVVLTDGKRSANSIISSFHRSQLCRPERCIHNLVLVHGARSSRGRCRRSPAQRSVAETLSCAVHTRLHLEKQSCLDRQVSSLDHTNLHLSQTHPRRCPAVPIVRIRRSSIIEESFEHDGLVARMPSNRRAVHPRSTHRAQPRRVRRSLGE